MCICVYIEEKNFAQEQFNIKMHAIKLSII